MKSNIHFISGLPRSGSTMLAAILKQNTCFVAGMTSPLSNLFRGIEDATAKRVETSVFVSDIQREHLLKGLFSIYYGNDWDDKTVFDTSRMWCARTSLILKLFPKSKLICCVRELGWIMDSFERIYRRNDRKPSAIYGFDTNGTVYSRTSGLAEGGGVVGYAFNALKESLASGYNKRILLVDYEDLCKNPQKTIDGLYEFIDEPKFKHNFKSVEYSAGEFDRQLGVEGLHDVQGEVEWRPRETILPKDLFNRYANDNFWRESKWSSK